MASQSPQTTHRQHARARSRLAVVCQSTNLTIGWVPRHAYVNCNERPRLATASPARSSNTCPVIDFSFYIPNTKSPTTTGMYVRPTRIDSLHDRPSLSTLHLCPPCDFSISPMIIRLIPWSDQLLTPFIDFQFRIVITHTFIAASPSPRVHSLHLPRFNSNNTI